MKNEKYIHKKQGNILLSIGSILLVIIFAITFLLYYQVGIICENIRRDLFYASNNAIIAFDAKDLAYRTYTVNEVKTKEIIEYILNKNYTETEGSVTKIEVTDMKISHGQDEVTIDVWIRVTFKSLVNLAGKNEHEFKMNERVQISLMDYKTEGVE